MNYFSKIFGLVTKSDPTTENGGLFFAHYLVLKLMLGQEITLHDLEIFNSKMDNAYVEYGLYLRSQHHKKRTVSQDELIGMFVASKILHTGHRHFIWDYLINHGFNYPATGVDKTYNPANYYSLGVLKGSNLSIIFMPLYTFNLLISSNKPKQETSSKLIYLTSLYAMKEDSLYSKFLYKYFVWRMELMYGKKWIKSLYDVYFGRESMDHPLRKLVGQI